MPDVVNMSLKRTTRIVVGVVVLVLAVMVMQWMVSTAPRAEVNPEAAPARSVIVMESASTDVRRRFTGYGIADAVYHADVPTRVTSTVLELPASTRAGAPVVEGQLPKLDAERVKLLTPIEVSRWAKDEFSGENHVLNKQERFIADSHVRIGHAGDASSIPVCPSPALEM